MSERGEDPSPLNGQLNMQVLIEDAKACAKDEAALVDRLAREILSAPAARPQVRRWAGEIQGRSYQEIKLSAPRDSAAEVGLSWASRSPGEIEISDASGGSLVKGETEDGAAYAGVWTQGGVIRLRVSNLGTAPANFAVFIGWL